MNVYDEESRPPLQRSSICGALSNPSRFGQKFVSLISPFEKPSYASGKMKGSKEVLHFMYSESENLGVQNHKVLSLMQCFVSF